MMNAGELERENQALRDRLSRLSQAREAQEEAQWWAYDGPEEERREILRQFMEAVIYAKQDTQSGVIPGLAEVPPEATTLIAAESFSLACEDAQELRTMPGWNHEDQAEDWKDLNFHRQVGEEVVHAAESFRGEPVRLVMEMEGRQVHVLISLPPREGTLRPKMPESSRYSTGQR